MIRKTVPHTRSIDGKTAIAVVCSSAWNSQKTDDDDDDDDQGQRDNWRRFVLAPTVLADHGREGEGLCLALGCQSSARKCLGIDGTAFYSRDVLSDAEATTNGKTL